MSLTPTHLAEFPLVFSHPRCWVIDKPSGLSVHRGWDDSLRTVVSILRNDGLVFAQPVHRLDRATSGALLLARDADASRELSQMFANQLVCKGYLALARGRVHAPTLVDAEVPIDENSKRRVPARTTIVPLEQVRNRFTLVVAVPHSGRMHQIRRHLRHLKAPIAGDSTYGNSRDNRAFREDFGLDRLALHAISLSLEAPSLDLDLQCMTSLPESLSEPFRHLGLSLENLGERVSSAIERVDKHAVSA